MPLFLSEQEFERCSHDSSLVAEKADAFIRELNHHLETVRAQADAASITAEQTCSIVEQKYVSLSSELSTLQSQNSQLSSALEERLSELAKVQAETHKLHLKSIEKDGDIERLSMEASELHKSKRQLIELVEQKDNEIGEKNATIKCYLDKIANLTDNAALREARLNAIEAELSRSHASCGRLSQEKELIERHNVWLNDELTDKLNCLNALRKTHGELEADISAKLVDAERRFNASSSSLKWNKDRVTELELKLTSLQEELCSSKDAAAANEERLTAEMATVTKLVELYKENSEEWSKKAGELEGVIKALETHLSQVENDYKEKLEKELSARKELEKEAEKLKEKLEKCEAEIESSRRANELSLLPLSSFTSETWLDPVEGNDMDDDNRKLVPSIPVGVSGTALAASLLRDGWSLAKMYSQYQETVDALRHEQLGRKQSQAILERVLYEIEEKAGVILDERAEHERLVEAYSVLDQKLQHSVSEQTTLERTLQHVKADLKRQERDCVVAQREIADLQKQVTVLLKECRDIQIRCGSEGDQYADHVTAISAVDLIAESDAENIISERLLTFKDISGLVQQNVQLRSLVRALSNEIENKEIELKEKLEMEVQKCTEEAASKVNAVLARAEEQGRMIESLHTSVSMYKRLYEEEHKQNSSHPQFTEPASENGRKDFMHLLEGCQESAKIAQERTVERVRSLEEDLSKLRNEIITLRSERDKVALEANFACEKLGRFMKEFEQQREETNGVLARNVEFSQLIIDYQRKLRESSESSQAAEELSRKANMEVSVLKQEKEILLNSEKRACDEVRSMSERVHRLQATLDTIQSVEEVREEARGVEKKKQDEYVKQIEREWAEGKKELEEERNNVRTLRLEREENLKNALRQVEEIGNKLAEALRTVADAEARAAVAEARYVDLERNSRSSVMKFADNDGEPGTSSSSAKEAVADLSIAKEEIEKLRAEVQINKDHMLQYKSIAQVNEVALKQMELAHETFKIEADKVKQSLESQLVSLKDRVSELENICMLKSKEAESAVAGKEEAISSAFSEIVNLKDEVSVKICKIAELEIQTSNLKEDLDKEHQKWRSAQTNYERQVILQSEAIQELTKTSRALASLQEEASELRALANVLRTENDNLKGKWEVEKLVLEEAKRESEKKCVEINEQNKILHSRLEALHIRQAEKDRDSAGIYSGSSDQGSTNDAGLQHVINYLRRSKEIAETEISLLRQEKLRLQTQVETAVKASEAAQAALVAERANSRALIFNEEEFKSIQLQVREMNLLRESNMQLREENKHNFEECQKLREISKKAQLDFENLESMLKERQFEVDICRKEIEIQKVERNDLEKRVAELLERCNDIDVGDYDRMKEEVQRMQVNLREKDAQLEEINKVVSEKTDAISQLEEILAKNRTELNERERRINEIMDIEASLNTEVQKQKKMAVHLKRKSESLAKEKDELSKENQALSKQLEDSKQAKKIQGDVIGEQVSGEKVSKERESRIQLLEKTVERQREEHKNERAMRLKTQKAIMEYEKNLNQEKTKLVEEIEKHKQALKRIADEVEKLKLSKGSLPEDTSAVLNNSGNTLDEVSAPYFQCVENFDRIANAESLPIMDTSTPAETLPIMDTTSLGQATHPASSLVQSILPFAGTTSTFPSTTNKSTEEREKSTITVAKTNVETRKTGRKLVRPRIVRSEEPQGVGGDTEMLETEASSYQVGATTTKPAENQVNIIPLAAATQPPVRKRLASEPQEDAFNNLHGTTSVDVAAPVLKKPKGSDSPPENVEEQQSTIAPPLENLDNVPTNDESLDAVSDLLPHSSNDEGAGTEKDDGAGTEKDDVETTSQQQVEESKGDEILEEILDKPSETDQQAELFESGAEREEGEVVPDITDAEDGTSNKVVESAEFGGDGVPESTSAPGLDEEAAVAVEFGDEKTEESDVITEVNVNTADGNNDQVMVETTDNNNNSEKAPNVSATESGGGGGSRQGSPNISNAETEEAGGKSSTTINLQERARQRSALRQAGVLPSPGRGRGVRGRTPRGRVTRSSARGPPSSSGEQQG